MFSSCIKNEELMRRIPTALLKSCWQGVAPLRRNQAVSLFRNYAFYWIGMAMAVACLVLAFSRNATAASLAGIISIVAFVAYEYCDPTVGDQLETEPSAEEFQDAPDYAG